MKWRIGFLGCGGTLVVGAALTSAVLVARAASALAPFGMQRLCSGAVVSMMRISAVHVAAVAAWLGIVLATDGRSRGKATLLATAVIPLAGIAFLLAWPFMVVTALAYGVDARQFVADAIQVLSMSDVATMAVRSLACAILVAGMSAFLLPHLHVRLRSNLRKIVVAGLVIAPLLAALEMIFTSVGTT